MDSMPLMSSPIPMLVISTVYLFLVKIILPNFMEKRKAMDLTLITRCYNIFQVFCCGFFVNEYFRLGWTFPMTFDYNHTPSTGVQVFTKVLWANWILRIIELVETVFFILRKKNNQASFLHIYHHISSIIIIWLLEKYEQSKIYKVCNFEKFSNMIYIFHRNILVYSSNF
jgi:hypothetical protein